METLLIRRLSFGSILKINLIGNFVAFAPILFLSFFSDGVAKLNNIPVTGLKANFVIICLYFLFVLLFSFLYSLGLFVGLWIYSRFRKLEIKIIKD